MLQELIAGGLKLIIIKLNQMITLPRAFNPSGGAHFKAAYSPPLD
jgi:hypothetical protein